MFRVIPRLDIKAPNLVKGIRLEGLRKLGNPAQFAERYYEEGADELIYQDIVASLYERNGIEGLIRETAERIFIPLTVGGGIRTLDDIQSILRAGADKICINTAALKNPAFITQASERFGRQCIVVAIEAIRQSDGVWKAFSDNGREHTGRDAVEWAMQAVELGAGELLVTSVDREGTGSGFELDLLRRLAMEVPVPVIAHGGAGNVDDIVKVSRLGVDGVAVASLLHYGRSTIAEIKRVLADAGTEVRQ